MTEKQLHKLHRQDLLQLLLAQSREVAAEQAEINSQKERIEELEAGNARLIQKLDEKDETIERLKGKLNEKDALLEKLKGRLDQKDADIRRLREGGLVELPKGEGQTEYVVMRLEEIFRVARNAAEDYLHERSRLAAEAVERAAGEDADPAPEPVTNADPTADAERPRTADPFAGEETT